MLRTNLIFVIGIAAATAASWATLNRPIDEPSAPAKLQGFAFSPIRAGSDPRLDQYPDAQQLAADLRLIAQTADSVRTYSSDGSLQDIPAIASGFGMDVVVGIWLDDDRARNEARLKDLLTMASRNDNISRVIIGNEVLLRGDLSLDELIAVLDRMRAALDVPIGTAEPWHIWIEHPELASHVDFIGVHLLPYWEGIHVDAGVEHVAARVAALKQRFGDQPVVIAEVGWPSWGRSRGKAVASRANAARFLREFVQRAEQEGYEYFLLEAFDQPWKRADEGEVGAYWGVFDADRRPKFALSGPLIPLPQWRTLALISALIACAAFCLMVADGERLRLRGRLFLALTAMSMTSATVFSIGDYAQQYWTPVSAIVSALLLLALLGLFVIVLVEAHEWAEARWCRRTERTPPRLADDEPLPKVSIHVPAYQEPPQMLIETLRALAALDYPRYEVIVIDNNTADERLWRPVEAFCTHLGQRFRFFHVAPLAGYKAGALNFALRRTADDAAIVAVIDSDYKVDENWLRELVPEFSDPSVAIVQAPQAYRDGRSSLFKAMCDAEYRGFFKIGMITRNDRNAIIQHGTMTMIKKSVLEEVGGWAEWTITEDAELGLRVFEHGYSAVYTPQCFGRGLTPDCFADYKAQRFRWALGATQILCRHAKRLLGMQHSRLSFGQRYHFFAGWLSWLADGLNLLFNIVAVAWSALMIVSPLRFPPPLALFSTFVLGLFAFKIVKVIYLYRTQVRTSLLQTLGAAMAGLALVYIVGRAVIAGIFGKEARFYRTPKLADNHTLAGAISASLGESSLAIALLASAVAVPATAPFASIDRTVWCVLLVVLALPHLAALALSIASTLPIGRTEVLSPQLGDAITEAGRSESS